MIAFFLVLLQIGTPDLVDSLERMRSTDRAAWQALPTLSPVPDPHVTSHYDPSRTHPATGEARPHFGVDLRAPHGTPVRASGSGRILKATRSPSYGLVVDIDHGNGYITRYAHLSRVGAREGQVVRRGQVIGLSGATGVTTGPNLHYEVYRNGWQVDPCPFIVYRRDGASPEPLHCPTPVS